MESKELTEEGLDALSTFRDTLEDIKETIKNENLKEQEKDKAPTPPATLRR